MQNDEVLLDVIRGGEFVHPCQPQGPQPGRPARRRGGGRRHPARPEHAVGHLRVVGPRSLTGPECAQVWSEALGRPVRYAGDDDAALEAALAAHLTGYRLDDWLLVAAQAAALRRARHPRGARDDRAPPRPRRRPTTPSSSAASSPSTHADAGHRRRSGAQVAAPATT